MALQLKRALAIAALVFRTREARSAFAGRAAAFAASLHLRAVASVDFDRFERPGAFAVAALVFRTRDAHFEALLWAVLPHSLHGVRSDADCPDAPHLLHTRNLQRARCCLCPA